MTEAHHFTHSHPIETVSARREAAGGVLVESAAAIAIAIASMAGL
jgi:hypothetical protein